MVLGYLAFELLCEALDVCQGTFPVWSIHNLVPRILGLVMDSFGQLVQCVGDLVHSAALLLGFGIHFE